ncbi:S8 family serine peptidase [Desulforamulus putei]|uniref:S8 family serine peptidase n=1 Tax=Desulforamulus putei TaxID=74701 RepID=UPI002FDEE642
MFIIKRERYKPFLYCLIFLLVCLMLPWPVWADALASSYRFENNLAAGIMGIPGLWALAQGANGAGLTGQGQVIAVADAGLDGGAWESLHPDLKDRLVGVKDFSGDGWADPNGHGTHIAGSIVGTGARSQGAVKGIAPGAGLYFQATYNAKDDTLHIPSVYELLQDAYNAPGKPRIHVNSWGASFSDGIYDWDTYSMDKFVWEHPDMVVLKSAGNGYKTAKPFVSSPGAAKNAITVGSTEGARGVDAGSDNPDQVAGFSSRGTFDGRIKPEVLAPGTWILSTRKTRPDPARDNYIGMYNQFYGYMSGTSMSTALTAGSLALLRQYLQQKGHSPSAAQLKALLIFGARRLPGVAAVDQGFGRVDVEQSLIALEKGDARSLDGQGLKTGEKVTYTFTGNGKPFKAVLAYTDYPKTPGIGKDLVNDLDLKITGPGGKEVYWGNGYIDGDRLNNTEEIIVSDTKMGETYTIEVIGQQVVKGPQPFALVYGTLPYHGTIREVKDNTLTFTNGDVFKLDAGVGVRVVGGDAPLKNAGLKDIPAGAEVYLVFDADGKVRHLDALYTTVTSKVQSKEGNNQLIIFDGTRWTLADGAGIFVGGNEIKWSELPIEAEVKMTVNPVTARVWRVDVQGLPDHSPYIPLPISDREVRQAIESSRNTGKVVLAAGGGNETGEDKPVTLAIGAAMAAELYRNGRPVELKLPGLSVEIPAAEFGRIGQSEQGAQLQMRVAWQSVGEQSLPGTDPLMYLRPVGKLVEVRPAIVWPDGSQLAVSQSKNTVKVTVTSPIGATAGLNIRKIGAYRFNEMTRQWEFINSDYNPDTGKSVFTVDRFGKFAVLEASRTFNDITGHWAKPNIEIMAARHVVRGVTPETFGPNEMVTRGQFTVMLVRTLGLPEDPAAARFSDMPQDYWCAGAVGAGVKMGLVAGYSNGAFGPNDPITREQMAAMLVRAIRLNSNRVIPDSAPRLGLFADENTIAPWARTSVSIIVQEGLMRGRGENVFAPKALTTRAEAATVMVRLLEYRENNR